MKLGGKSTNHIDVWDFVDEQEADGRNRGLQEIASNVYGNGHTALYADMIGAIRQNRAPYVDAVAGRNALEMVLAVYQASAAGRPVRLPLTNIACEDFCGQFSQK